MIIRLEISAMYNALLLYQNTIPTFNVDEHLVVKQFQIFRKIGYYFRI